MTISVDVDIKRWEQQFKRQADAALKAGYDVQNNVAQQLYEKIKSYTPVLTGRLRDSWVIDYSNNEVTISNDQPYALRIEYGWSERAPDGMMRRALMEFPQLVGSVARKFSV